jgi:hypothetical protein
MASPTAAGQAITGAARLSEIGFAEFTSALVTDVFAALIDANIKQTKSYMDLVNLLATTLKDFINNTKDDISPQEIAQFALALKLPALEADPSSSTELTVVEAANLNRETKLPADAELVNYVATAGKLNSQIDSIKGAIAIRIAANKYNLLREMTRQGVLRLVVDNGIIETRLIFSTYGYTSHDKNRFDDFRHVAGALAISGSGGGFGLTGIGAASIMVSTSSSSDRDVNGSNVQIYGRVELRFKTDYVPLNP